MLAVATKHEVAEHKQEDYSNDEQNAVAGDDPSTDAWKSGPRPYAKQAQWPECDGGPERVKQNPMVG